MFRVHVFYFTPAAAKGAPAWSLMLLEKVGWVFEKHIFQWMQMKNFVNVEERCKVRN